MTAAAGAGIGREAAQPASREAADDVTSFVKRDPDSNLKSLQLMVENVLCGGCVRKIERALEAESDVESGRLNVATRRLTIDWTGPASRGSALVRKLAGLGYPVVPYDPEVLAVADNRHERELLKAMAVAGFAASEVMLLAVSIWAGHFSGIGDTSRTFMHWVQALIRLPAIVYAGWPLFRSALTALRAGHQHGRADLARRHPRACALRDHPPGRPRLLRQRDYAALLPPDRPLSRQPGQGRGALGGRAAPGAGPPPSP